MNNIHTLHYNGYRDRAVCIATRYGLDGPGIESRSAERFSAPVEAGPGAQPASCTMGTGSLSREQRGRGAALTIHPPSSADVKEEYSYTFTPPLSLQGLF